MPTVDNLKRLLPDLREQLRNQPPEVVFAVLATRFTWIQPSPRAGYQENLTLKTPCLRRESVISSFAACQASPLENYSSLLWVRTLYCKRGGMLDTFFHPYVL